MSIIVTSAPPRLSRYQILEAGDLWVTGVAVGSLDGWLSLTLPGKAQAPRLTLGQSSSGSSRAVAGHGPSGALLGSWHWEHHNLLYSFKVYNSMNFSMFTIIHSHHHSDF